MPDHNSGIVFYCSEMTECMKEDVEWSMRIKVEKALNSKNKFDGEYGTIG